jgi:thymidylate synthase (FAD)
MKIIEPSYKILSELNRDKILKALEFAGRTCYKSENNITVDSASDFVKNKLIATGHHAMIEHEHMTVKFISNRGFTHEIVRHRIASFGQESTRFCNYGKGKFGSELTLIRPYWADNHAIKFEEWILAMKEIERLYVSWTNWPGNVLPPNGARGILPQDIKAEIVMTANLREWMHIFNLRAKGTTGKPHPDMLRLIVPLQREVAKVLPEIFGDPIE